MSAPEIPIEFFNSEQPPQKDYSQLVHVDGDTFWLICGYSGRYKVNPATPHSYHSTVYAWNSTRASWTKKSFAPGHAERLPPLTAHSATVFQTFAGPRVVVYGGAWIGKDDEEDNKTAKFSTNDCFILGENATGQIEVQVIEGAEVVVTQPESTFRYPPQGLYFASTRADDTMYVVAGQCTEDVKSSIYYNSCWPLKWRFDARGIAKLEVGEPLRPNDAEFPVRAAATATHLRDGRIFVIGGQYQRRAVNDVFELQPARRVVRRVHPKGSSVALPPCAWHVESTDGRYVYALGGGLGPFVYRLDPERGAWQRSVEGHEVLAAMVMGTCACTVDGDVYCFGGIQGKKWNKSQLIKFKPSALQYTSAPPPATFVGDRKRPAPPAEGSNKKRRKERLHSDVGPRRTRGSGEARDSEGAAIDILGDDNGSVSEDGEDGHGGLGTTEQASEPPPTPTAAPASSPTGAGMIKIRIKAPSIGLAGASAPAPAASSASQPVPQKPLAGPSTSATSLSQQASSKTSAPSVSLFARRAPVPGATQRPPGADRTVAETLAECAPDGLPPELLHIDRLVRAALGDLLPYETHQLLAAALRPLCSGTELETLRALPVTIAASGEALGELVLGDPEHGEQLADLWTSGLDRHRLLADRAANARTRATEADAIGGVLHSAVDRARREAVVRLQSAVGSVEKEEAELASFSAALRTEAIQKRIAACPLREYRAALEAIGAGDQVALDARRAHYRRIRTLFEDIDPGHGLFSSITMRIDELVERVHAAARELSGKEQRAREALSAWREAQITQHESAAMEVDDPDVTQGRESRISWLRDLEVPLSEVAPTDKL